MRRAGQALHDSVQAMGDQLTCGFVGAPIICEALCQTGHERDAYQLLLHERQPGLRAAAPLNNRPEGE